MGEVYAPLAAAANPELTALLYATLALYALACGASVFRPALGGFLLGAGVAVHVALMLGRGLAIDFLPLTNKLESFSAAALGIALVALGTWQPSRLYGALLTGLAALTLAVAQTFPLDLGFPPPLMRTLWYPLHVPLSFLAYGLWTATAVAGLVWFWRRDEVWLARVDSFALRGFALWTVAMVFGGLWGVVAWGAYFMWDAKIIWSVIMWLHYASFVHLRLTPSLRTRPWVRPALALVGFAWVLVAYVGTSFFFGGSSHAFG